MKIFLSFLLLLSQYSIAGQAIEEKTTKDESCINKTKDKNCSELLTTDPNILVDSPPTRPEPPIGIDLLEQPTLIIYEKNIDNFINFKKYPYSEIKIESNFKKKVE